ncbi:MAG: hypothetical protein MHM6MM_007546 [Cercozoa sp. M6MM]
MCDKDNGCLSTTEAMSVSNRISINGSPFMCRTDSFFGVHPCIPVFFTSGSTPSECVCPENKACVIGNGDNAPCSTRFWLGYCDPTETACVPQIAVSVKESKVLFKHATPTPDLGLGGPCLTSTSPDPCTAANSTLQCINTCEVEIGEVPSFAEGYLSFGLEITANPVSRNLDPEGVGTDGICALDPASPAGAGTPCMCNTDCDATQDLVCVVAAAGSLVGQTDIQNDLSLTGTCWKQPITVGASTCTTDADCIPGRRCQDRAFGLGGLNCLSEPGIPDGCSGSDAHCTIGSTCDVDVCVLPNDERCRYDEQCDSDNCMLADVNDCCGTCQT